VSKGSLMNVWTFVILALIVSFFSYIIIQGGSEINKNPHAQLDDFSKGYICDLTNNINDCTYNSSVNNYALSGNDVSTGIDANANINDSQKSPAWSFALEFLFSKEKTTQISNNVGHALSIPSWIAYRVLQLPSGAWDPFISAINWIFNIGFIISIYLLIKGIIGR